MQNKEICDKIKSWKVDMTADFNSSTSYTQQCDHHSSTAVEKKEKSNYKNTCMEKEKFDNAMPTMLCHLTSLCGLPLSTLYLSYNCQESLNNTRHLTQHKKRK